MGKLAFTNREEELARLNALMARGQGGLVIVSGRRRIGKTRLLLEWVDEHDGLYTVADTSTPEVQRRYLADAIAVKLPGFADVSYPDWGAMFSRLARDARAADWRGPIVFDELPYLIASSPELSSTLQRWIDHDARRAGLTIVLAGSSQRLMQGLGLEPSSPLFGRAEELLELAPLEARFLKEALGFTTVVDVVNAFTAWGGVPRYWELAAGRSGDIFDVVDQLVLDPRGPLHKEPDYLLIEEVPPAAEVRPLLDAVGAGAHRVSEIGARIGHKATSLSRPLDRLIGMGLLLREVPFGESEKRSKRSLYKIADSFFRLWFRVVAPNRALLASSPAKARRELLARYWPSLASTCWEELCRQSLPTVPRASRLGREGPWGPAGRWWRGNAPEWDILALSMDGRKLLLGEAKWSLQPFTRRKIEALAQALARRPAPEISGARRHREVVRALFLPSVAADIPDNADDSVLIVNGADVLMQGAGDGVSFLS